MSSIQKFCHACGRIISRSKSSDVNFLNQKYCSNSCKSQKPTQVDRSIESHFLQSIRTGPVSRKDGVLCTTIEAAVFGEKSSEGMEKALERERVRRAARRIVVFPDLESSKEQGSGRRLECVQNGKVVDPSFAKSDFGVREADWP